MQYFKKVNKFLTEYGTPISILAAIVPFLGASISTIMFTGGDSETANYIFHSVGVFEIWISTLIYVITSVFQVSIVVFLVVGFKRFMRLETEGYFNYYYGTAIALLFLYVPLSIIIGFAVGLIFRKIIKLTHPTKPSRAESNPVAYFIFLSLLIFYFGMSNFPNLPYSKLNLKNDEKVVGIVISDRNNQSVLVSKENKKIQIINDADVVKVEICTNKKSWLSDSPTSLFIETKLINNC